MNRFDIIAELLLREPKGPPKYPNACSDLIASTSGEDGDVDSAAVSTKKHSRRATTQPELAPASAGNPNAKKPKKPTRTRRERKT